MRRPRHPEVPPPAKRSRGGYWPEEFAGKLHSAHKLRPLPESDWQADCSGCQITGSVTDGAGCLIVTTGQMILRIHATGRHDVLCRDATPDLALIGCTPVDCPDGHAAILYDRSNGYVSWLPIAAHDSDISEIGVKSLACPFMHLTQPFPDAERLVWHNGTRLVLRRSPSHLQILRPGASLRQEVEREVKAKVGNCPDFVAGKMVANPATGDVYFLDKKQCRLFCWKDSGSVVIVKLKAELAAKNGGRLQLGADCLLATWRATEKKLLKIDLQTMEAAWVELVEESGASWRFSRNECRLLSGTKLFVFDPLDLSGVRCADLTQDELVSKSSRELHSIDWASPSVLVKFKPSGEAIAGEDALSVDRRVLCARSAYFRAMFDSGMQECETGVVDLPPDVGIAAVRCLVDYLYTDLIDPIRALGFEAGSAPEDLDPDALRECALLCMEVVKLADVYQLPRLHHLAELFVHMHGLGVSGVLQLLARADALGAASIEEACLQFILEHSKELKRTQFEALTAVVHGEPRVAMKLLTRCL